MKKILAAVFLFIVLHTLAHEFWLQPAVYKYNAGDTATISFFVGENFTGEYWGKTAAKINLLQHISQLGTQDISSSICNGKTDSLKIILKNNGGHLIVFNSTNSFIKLDAKKFNDYLKEDGHYAAIAYRSRHNEQQKEGTEYYQRSVKTLLQCGNVNDTVYKTHTSLPLDIVPLVNPYKLTAKKTVAFSAVVYFNNKPLPGALVKIWHKQNGNVTMKEQKTNSKGIVAASVTTTGQWMISCVNMVPNTKDTVAQWQSYWGSLTFGY
jgi:uncharacterized GH25 family protein